MARRARSNSRFVRPAPRSNIWVSTNISLVNISAGATATLLATLNAAALLLRPFTIVRTRFVLGVQSDQQVAGETQQGAMGMQVVTETAAAAGIASLPTPLTETDADFFVYQPWAFSFLFASAVGVQENNGMGNYWTVDSKAMRKVGTDDDVAWTVEGVNSNGYNIGSVGRMLVKLH